ncbi:MAG: ATP-binding protein, partial [Pseudomonadales bacterium]
SYRLAEMVTCPPSGVNFSALFTRFLRMVIVVWADKNTTMTILRNLVNNALKFTPEGGQVTISASRYEQMVKIRVSDTGVGIPKEKMDSLFKLQDKKSTYGTSGEKGLGLGLQLVYEFIEMNGGHIEVESEIDKGTSFIVSLPLYGEK